MRILHWTESFHPRIGGTEVFVDHLIRAQQSAGHVCGVLTSALPQQPERETRQGLGICRLPFHRPLIERSLTAIRSVQDAVEDLLASFRPDILHLHTAQASALYFTRLPSSLRPPTVYTAHDGIPADIAATNSLLARIVARANRIAAPSDYIHETLAQLLPGTMLKATRIHGSLPEPLVGGRPLPDTPCIIALGRWVADKGFDTLLHAADEIRHVMPNLDVILAGDGPESGTLHQLVDTLNLRDTVRFTGWIPPDSVPTAIEQASLVVVPSRWQEPFGLVALQAMQAGRAVVASRVGGLPELVDHGRTGHLVSPDQPTMLAESILRALDDPHRLATLGINGRARAERLFSWQRCVASYQTLYEETLSSTSSR